MVSQHSKVFNFLQMLAVPFIHDWFKAHKCNLGRFSAQLKTKNGLHSNAASSSTEQPVAMLAKGLLSPVLAFIELVHLASRGSSPPSHFPGQPPSPLLTRKEAHAELSAVCTFNSFFSCDTLHIFTGNSSEVEASIQLYLQLKCLEASVTFVCEKPTYPYVKLCWRLSGKITRPL